MVSAERWGHTGEPGVFTADKSPTQTSESMFWFRTNHTTNKKYYVYIKYFYRTLCLRVNNTKNMFATIETTREDQTSGSTTRT